MRTKDKKTKKQELPLVDVLSKKANPMAMRGILSFLEVCSKAGIENVPDDMSDEQVSLLHKESKTYKTYELRGDIVLIKMLTQELVPPIFLEGRGIKKQNGRMNEEGDFENPYYPKKGDPAQLYQKALDVLEDNGCIDLFVGADEGKDAKSVYYRITDEGITLLKELVARPNTIRDFDKEDQEAYRRDLVKNITEGRQREADEIAAARLAYAAAVQQERAAKAERIRIEAERSRNAFQKKAVADAAVNAEAAALPANALQQPGQQSAEEPVVKKLAKKAPVPKKEKPSVATKEVQTLSAENRAEQESKAEQGILTFLGNKLATDGDHAIYAGDITFALSMSADQSGWTGSHGKNPFKVSFEISEPILKKLSEGDEPLIALDETSKQEGNKPYYYITKAGLDRLAALETQTSAEKTGVNR